MEGNKPDTPAEPNRVTLRNSSWLRRGLVILIILTGIVFSARLGAMFRHWIWDVTAPIRFVPDIDRGYDWGRQCAANGYLNQYEKMQFQKPTDSNWLDYAPLRLAVMAAWGRWSIDHFPDVKVWHTNHSYALTAPVMHFNMLMEAIGIACAFFLTRHWAVRALPPPIDPRSLRWFFRGWIPGLSAALLLWFNPAMVLSGYGWPTWDLWIIPMFLLAALMASWNWWFTAGVAIGIGAMFKGQQFLSLPVFIIWSLILCRPTATLQLCCGCIFAIALVASPWLVTFIPPEALASARAIQSLHAEASFAPGALFQIPRIVDLRALLWIAGVLFASIALPFVSWLTLELPKATSRISSWRRILASRWAWRAFAASATIALVIWPWLLKRNRENCEMGLIAAAGLAVVVLLIRPRGIAHAAAGAVGMALLLCMSVFHGSTAWFDCGIHFGTVHWPMLYMGLTDNFPAILQTDFHWPMNEINVTVFTIPTGWWTHQPIDVPMKTFLLTIFFATLILCSAGLGLHARRKNARVLIALTAPWLMFFCFPPQIHERYLLYAAGISCICVGTSFGMTLLGMFLSIVTFVMTLHCMLVDATPAGRKAFGQLLGRQFSGMFSSNTGEALLRIFNGAHPDLGYAVVLSGLIFLYFSIAVQFPWRFVVRRVIRRYHVRMPQPQGAS